MEQYKNYLKIGKIEGYSYLILIFVAMPMKYWFNIPIAVKVTGYVHGILFIAFMYQIIQLMVDKHFNFKQGAISFILSLLPFGTFFLKQEVIDKK